MKLLPCPFCMSKAEKQFTQRRYEFEDAIECTNPNCGASISGESCEEKWNSRVIYQQDIISGSTK